MVEEIEDAAGWEMAELLHAAGVLAALRLEISKLREVQRCTLISSQARAKGGSRYPRRTRFRGHGSLNRPNKPYCGRSSCGAAVLFGKIESFQKASAFAHPPTTLSTTVALQKLPLTTFLGRSGELMRLLWRSSRVS